jgi:hypothetical protein
MLPKFAALDNAQRIQRIEQFILGVHSSVSGSKNRMGTIAFGKC